MKSFAFQRIITAEGCKIADLSLLPDGRIGKKSKKGACQHSFAYLNMPLLNHYH
jgi:hypothetical protein